MADKESTQTTLPWGHFEVDPEWAGKVLDREVLTPSGSSVGHLYQAFATGTGDEPLTGWGKNVVWADWTPGTTDVVFAGGTQVTSGSPPSSNAYNMGSWSGKLVKSLGSDQAIYQLYEGTYSGGVWSKTGSLLGVLIVRSDAWEYHKAASTSGPPTSISGDRTMPMYLEAKSSISIDPGSGDCWYCAVDPKI